MSLSRIVGRWKLLAPALISLGLGSVMFGAAMESSLLTCSRATGTCTWTRDSLTSHEVSTFAMAAVREVRFVEGLGKHGRRAATMLVFASGRDTTIGEDTHDAAERLFQYTREFFSAAATEPTYRYATGGKSWMYVAALACAIAAVVLGVHGFRKRVIETAPTKYNGKQKVARTLAEQAARSRRIYQAGAVIGALVAASVVVLWFGERGQGTLALDCRTRCMFAGFECTPGAKSELSFEPGTHTVQVLNATGSAVWRTETFEIRAGETTGFVCE